MDEPLPGAAEPGAEGALEAYADLAEELPQLSMSQVYVDAWKDNSRANSLTACCQDKGVTWDASSASQNLLPPAGESAQALQPAVDAISQFSQGDSLNDLDFALLLQKIDHQYSKRQQGSAASSGEQALQDQPTEWEALVQKQGSDVQQDLATEAAAGPSKQMQDMAKALNLSLLGTPSVASAASLGGAPHPRQHMAGILFVFL